MLSHFIGLSLPELIQAAGYFGIFCIIVAETGLPFGFIFPGDSLLFAAGLLASQGTFNLVVLLILTTTAAIIGDSIGYALGHRFGPALFKGQGRFFFNENTILRTEAFYEKYGMRAVIIARFVPTVRTFVPIFAGLGSMKYRTFLTYNIAGALLWGTGVTYLGYVLGRVIPGIDAYLIPIVFGIIVLSSLPVALEFWKARKEKSTIPE